MSIGENKMYDVMYDNLDRFDDFIKTEGNKEKIVGGKLSNEGANLFHKMNVLFKKFEKSYQEALEKGEIPFEDVPAFTAYVDYYKDETCQIKASVGRRWCTFHSYVIQREKLESDWKTGNRSSPISKADLVKDVTVAFQKHLGFKPNQEMLKGVDLDPSELEDAAQYSICKKIAKESQESVGTPVWFHEDHLGEMIVTVEPTKSYVRFACKKEYGFTPSNAMLEGLNLGEGALNLTQRNTEVVKGKELEVTGEETSSEEEVPQGTHVDVKKKKDYGFMNAVSSMFGGKQLK